jgi:hypothetical protein
MFLPSGIGKIVPVLSMCLLLSSAVPLDLLLGWL